MPLPFPFFRSPPASTSLSPDAQPISASSSRSTAKPTEQAKALVDEILREADLYNVLGVKRDAKSEEIRRAYIRRCRIVHPDKFPTYPAATSAFQKLSFAYETLSKPSSRRFYDLSPHSPCNPSAEYHTRGEDTFNGVLGQIWREMILEGDFEMVRALVPQTVIPEERTLLTASWDKYGAR
ncbi:DnaJ-domain-containing protein [Atractiella rhizophila]|nr:DnaJ-domain-containing protein [Atractiella rhizophila]